MLPRFFIRSNRSLAALYLAIAAILPPAAIAGENSNAMVEAYNSIGQTLFLTFRQDAGNVVISPYSIGSAMSMALSGARGETETEMTRVLKPHPARSEVGAAYSTLQNVFRRYDNNKAVTLRSANAIAVVREDMVSDAYRQDLKTIFGAEIFPANKASQINDWVAKKTNGKIKNAIDDLDPNSAAALINTVYFKARWDQVFDPRETSRTDFHTSASRVTQVSMMRQRSLFRLSRGKGYRAISLNYDDGKLGTVLVLPDQNEDLGAITARLDNVELSRLFDQLRRPTYTEVDLQLPRFKVQLGPLNLKRSFEQAGMHLPFEREKADFSGITGKPSGGAQNVWISNISHCAMFEVKEEGAEGAASTVITLGEGAAPHAPRQPEIFHVDRPFLFYVIDYETGGILLQGRIVEPKE